MQNPQQQLDLGHYDFDIIQEDWNTYELNDHSILRGRTFLVRAGKAPPGSPAGPFMLYFERFFRNFVAPDKRGTPGPPLTPDEVQVTEEKVRQHILMPIAIISSHEVWNLYRIHDSTESILQLKLLVSEVFRIKDRFGPLGEPALTIQNSVTAMPATKGTHEMRK